MADLGFLPGVTRILAATPAGGQRLLFSATLDNGVDKLVQRFLRSPITHSVDEIDAPPVAMTHHVFHVSGAAEKTQLVHALASGTGRRILFMRTKHQARKLAKQLTDAGVPSVDLHGNLSQPARDRNLALFSSGDARVLVATDIAARGVHVDDVELVVARGSSPSSTRRISIVRAAPRARAAQVTWSPSCFPSSVAILSSCYARRAFRLSRNRCGPIRRACSNWSARSLPIANHRLGLPLRPRAAAALAAVDRPGGAADRRTAVAPAVPMADRPARVTAYVVGAAVLVAPGPAPVGRRRAPSLRPAGAHHAVRRTSAAGAPAPVVVAGRTSRPAPAREHRCSPSRAPRCRRRP